MPSITEQRLRFDFPEGWNVSAYDKESFFQGQMARFGDMELVCKKCKEQLKCLNCSHRKVAGIAGIDILAIAPDNICWQIEVKDYRLTREKQFEFLADAVAVKVRDTLAGLMAARLNANLANEKSRAQGAVEAKQIRVVLHLQQPPTNNPLRSLKSQRRLVLDRLKQLVKAVDPHPQVVCIGDMDQIPWTVTEVPQ